MFDLPPSTIICFVLATILCIAGLFLYGIPAAIGGLLIMALSFFVGVSSVQLPKEFRK